MSVVPLEIARRERDGIVILDLRGRISLGPEDSRLHEHLVGLLQAGRKRVILNLRDVSSVDNAAVGLLILCAEAFQKNQGRLVLLDRIGKRASADEVLKLDTAVPAYAGEQDAVNSFFPERAVPHYDLLAFLEGMNESEREPQAERESRKK
ncbi:MAG TPA: STAS domain-containing protein [Bryobacteraceae bacterium]